MAAFHSPSISDPAKILPSYLHARMQATLDKLEREARRMFQLEEELSSFSNQYYTIVGDAAERLAQVEQKQIDKLTVADTTIAIPDMLAQRDASIARRQELKSRYRSLAKEIHPDRAMVVASSGTGANHMHTLNAAYQHGDLAALLKLEAHMALEQLAGTQTAPSYELECALREIEKAAETYAQGYRTLLNSPLNELMLRAMSARLAGWDWMDAVRRKVERTIEEKERAAALANIAAISAWRETVSEAEAS